MIYSPTLDDFNQFPGIYNRAMEPFYNSLSQEQREIEKSVKHTKEAIKIFCYKQSQKILGYSAFYCKNDHGLCIDAHYVDPICQRQEIGKDLLGAMESFARERRMAVIALETHSKADWAINFYLKNGYEIVNDRIDQSPYNLILDKRPYTEQVVLAKIIGLYLI